LEEAWKNYKNELDEIDLELRLLSNPETKALEEKKLELLGEISRFEREADMLKKQINEIDKKLISFQ
jgi:chromosome segregation ATPase